MVQGKQVRDFLFLDRSYCSLCMNITFPTILASFPVSMRKYSHRNNLRQSLFGSQFHVTLYQYREVKAAAPHIISKIKSIEQLISAHTQMCSVSDHFPMKWANSQRASLTTSIRKIKIIHHEHHSGHHNLDISSSRQSSEVILKLCKVDHHSGISFVF